jgi:predicted amidohydrolase YtcJ
LTDGYLFRNGPIYTMASPTPVEALVTRGDTIVHVGPEPSPPPWAKVIDLGGRPLLPGLCDCHLHLVLAAEQRAAVDCRLAPDVETVQDRVGERARLVKPGEWITGIGWEKKTLFREKSPSPAPLDEAAPENPVYLLSKDVHSAWLNTPALLALGARSKNIPEKCVLHREQGLVIEEVMELRERLVPPLSPAQKRELVGPFIRELHAQGITTVHTNEGIEELSVFRDHLRDAPNHERLRVHWNPVFHGPDELRRRFAEAEAEAVPGWLGVGGAKLFLDGTLGSLTAALSAPYTGTEGDLGMLTMEPGELADWLGAIGDVGTHGVFHVIGDRAVALLLAQLEQHGPAAQHRLEHAQLLPPENTPGGSLEGLVLSGQPSHMWGDREIVARNLTDELSRRAYAYRTMLDRGGLVVFGSDAPVETINPWVGIQAAVTRLEDDATPPWNGDERLTLFEALAAHTSTPARIHGFATGTLEVGRKADLVVLDRDPFAVDPTRLRDMRVEMTFLDGERVLEAG